MFAFFTKGAVKINGAWTSVPITKPKFVLAAAAEVAPVPPFNIPTVPVTFDAFPVMSPVIFVASIPVANFALVILPSKIFIVVTALFAMVGKADVPVKSPDNWIFPFTVGLASTIVAILDATCKST